MKHSLRSGLAAALVAALLPAAARSAELAEVEACVERNLPGHTSVEVAELTAIDRVGGMRQIRAKHYWKRMPDGTSRHLLEVDAPPEVRGSAYLLLEKKGGGGDEVFSFLPDLQKVRRLQSRAMSGSLFGTDFSYEDFRHLQSVASAAGRTRLPDGTVDGRAVYVIEVKPPPDSGSEYERIVGYLDRETCIPLKMEFQTPGGALRKELRVDPASLTRAGKGWVARSVAIRDLVNETQTKLEVSAIEVDGDVPDRLFTVVYLERKR
jgi:hypothetical protein